MAGDESIDWRRLREFAGTELTKSYVLSWQLDGETLRIDVDLQLDPDHPFYEKPRPAEKVCIRPASIEFPYCASVRSDSTDDDGALAETVSKLALGAIHGMRRMHDGPYELTGEFGCVTIDAERPILKLQSV